MKIAIGADHAGFELKEKVKLILQRLGHDVVDFGTGSTESVDYPDFGLKVARSVASGQSDRGIAICWTGNGMTMAANKVDGIRASLCLNVDMAKLAREHNDANVLTMASKYTPDNVAEQIVMTWLTTSFDGGRHERRVNKIMATEKDDTLGRIH
ncbi:MAG: ribose 5-phosphate isomerase B [candidate division Zixibacteria bacterium]|nr:ribose 5-phosphate isomerase B [candidate division Zixibacteria bacterium]